MDGKGQQDRSIREDEKIGRLTLDEIRARRPSDVRVLTDYELRKVQAATRQERAAEYLRLVRVKNTKGFKDGFVGRCYRDIWGTWPRFTEQELAGVVPAERPFLRLVRRETASPADTGETHDDV
jgi:hypothetical protein